MRSFIGGIISALMLGCLLAASEGGWNIAWETELKRPEAQRAISKYIQSNCSATLYPGRLEAIHGSAAST
jgi:hypothetical protein